MSKTSSSSSLPPDAQSRLKMFAKLASSSVVDESQLSGGRSEQLDLDGFTPDPCQNFNVQSRDIDTGA